MLSEVYRLRRALEESGMEMPKLHPDIKIPGTTSGPIVRGRLAKNGAVVALEGVTPAEFPGLWTHMDGNQNSFPVLRIREPLLLAPSEHRFSWQAAAGAKAKKVSAADKRREMQAAAVQFAANVSMASTLELIDRIGTSKGKLLAAAAEQAGIDVIAHVCQAFQAALVRPDGQDTLPAFLDGLRAQTIKFLDTCEENYLEAVELLLFTPAAQTSKDKRVPVQLALDSDDADSRMYRNATRTAIALALLGKEPNAEPVLELHVNTSTVACAFTGSRSNKLQTQKFPQVKLPIVANGGASLFTMNSASPCNKRYGQENHALMPISQSLVRDMLNALSHIVEPKREGKTWHSIAGEKPDQFDLLIVYVDGKPEIDASFASLFAANIDLTQQQYDIDVEAVCEALNGIVKEMPDSRLNLFIVRSVNDGQNVVVLTETPTVAEVLQGAKWWQHATNNVPFFELPVVIDKQLQYWRPLPLLLSQVALTLTQLWTPTYINSDEKKKKLPKVRGMAFGELLNMMLPRPQKRRDAAHHILQTVIPRQKTLLIGVGECLNGARTDNPKEYKRKWDRYDDTARKVALRAASLLGIALYALDSNKEEYMTHEAFRVGQMLALADRLHYCYCTVVRNKSYPQSLIGNAAFDTALDDPEQAFATLAIRMKIYIGWAGTVQPQDYKADRTKHNDAHAAIKVLEQYKLLTAHFSNKDLPRQNEVDNKMRAQMLLGYLAGPDALPQNTTNTDTDEQTDADPEGQS